MCCADYKFLVNMHGVITQLASTRNKFWSIHSLEQEMHNFHIILCNNLTPNWAVEQSMYGEGVQTCLGNVSWSARSFSSPFCCHQRVNRYPERIFGIWATWVEVSGSHRKLSSFPTYYILTPGCNEYYIIF